MLDFSKPFDRISSNTFIAQLKKTDLTFEVVNIVDIMFGNYMLSLNCKGFMDGHWLIVNGSRSGVIIIPILFSCYIE